MILDEIRALRSPLFLVRDHAVFSQHAEIPTHLALVSINSAGQLSNGLYFLGSEDIDEFAPLGRQDTFGALQTENLYTFHATTSESTGHFTSSALSSVISPGGSPIYFAHLSYFTPLSSDHNAIFLWISVFEFFRVDLALQKSENQKVQIRIWFTR